MTHHRLPEVARRLARIDGHLHSVLRMTAEGRSYREIVQQMNAVCSTLNGALDVILVGCN